MVREVCAAGKGEGVYGCNGGKWEGSGGQSQEKEGKEQRWIL